MCAKRKISLEEYAPDIAKQWHPTKNGKLKPTDISYGSEKKCGGIYPMMIPTLENILTLNGLQECLKEPMGVVAHFYQVREFGQDLMIYKLNIQN